MKIQFLHRILRLLVCWAAAPAGLSGLAQDPDSDLKTRYAAAAKSLSDPSYALRALETLEAPDAREYAGEVRKLIPNGDDWLEDQAAATLASMLGKVALDELVKLAPSVQPRTRFRIMSILDGYNDPRALDLAVSLISAPPRISFEDLGPGHRADKVTSPGWRNGAIRVIQRRGDESAIPKVKALLRHEWPSGRVGAIRALNLLNARAHWADIAAMLADNQPFEVRMEAIMALTALNAKESVAQIASELDRKSWLSVDREEEELLRDHPPDFYPHLSYREYYSLDARYCSAIYAALLAFGAEPYIPLIRTVLKRDLSVDAAMSTVLTLFKLKAISETEGAGAIAAAMRRSSPFHPEALQVLANLNALEHLDVFLACESVNISLFQRMGLNRRTEFIAGFLSAEDERVREGTIRLLTGFAAIECAPQVGALLAPSFSRRERESALSFLEKFPNPEAAPRVRVLLADTNSYSKMRALVLLRRMKARGIADDLLPLLEDGDTPVRLEALRSLRTLGAEKHAAAAAAFLSHRDPKIREEAIETLAILNPTLLKDQLPSLLGDVDTEVASSAMNAVGKVWDVAPASLFPAILEGTLGRRQNISGILASLKNLYGSRSPFAAAIPLLGEGDLPADPSTARPAIEALDEVRLLAESERRPRLAVAAGTVITRIVKSAEWDSGDATWLEALAARMGTTNGLRQEARLVAAAAARQYDRSPVRVALRWLLWAGVALSIVTAFWFLVLQVYPRSSAVQRLVWNRRFRHLSGLGIAVTLLRRSAFLHQTIWKPFREELLPPEEMQTFDEWTFFDSIRMAPLSPTAGEPIPALKELRNLRGVWVLQGVSGLGKTTLLQCLATESQSPAAFVRASTCQEGLLETLSRRLPEHAQGDPAFLRMLVKSGSLLVMIDAVHEAAPPVQERLVSEVDSLSGGKFLLTTQPVVRIAPKNSTVCEVLPLRPEDTNEFLLKQGNAAIEAMHGNSVSAKREAFAVRVRDFLEEFHSLPETHPRARALHRMLSNPMDAVFAAEVLASGDIPQPGQLLAQRIGLVKTDYEAATGTPFPDLAFATHLCASRLTGAPSVNMDGFPDIAAVLARHRLLRKGPGDDAGWRFRHDRIMDWLLLPALSSVSDHKDFLTDDPRFAAAREIHLHAAMT